MEMRFNKPPCLGTEIDMIQQAINTGKLSGDNAFSKKCQDWFNNVLGGKTLLTPSCTHALEMAALLIDIKPGDEVIMPSYTFVSTANAFVLRGAIIVFVDVRADTMNIDESLVEAAITDKTRAIVPVHYAGVICEMDELLRIGRDYGIPIIEDAAQAISSTYKGREAGADGVMSAFSFHETKNVTAGGEGGLLSVNDVSYYERAEIIREKGTNRSQFFKGQVDKYTWVDVGSSYLPSEIQAAYLYAQLLGLEKIQGSRMSAWNRYYQNVKQLEDAGNLLRPYIPEHCEHNAHMFYIKVENSQTRDKVLSRLQASKVGAVFHYVPLHSSPGGKKYGRFYGDDRRTTSESEKIIRLPLYYDMSNPDIDFVTDQLYLAMK
jgi:dTDP-4-amino-4,6-dideoxygalactose transaminase